MYTESSNTRPGVHFLMMSPAFASLNNDICMSFFYHMYGTGMGTLNVKVAKNNVRLGLE